MQGLMHGLEILLSDTTKQTNHRKITMANNCLFSLGTHCRHARGSMANASARAIASDLLEVSTIVDASPNMKRPTSGSPRSCLHRRTSCIREAECASAHPASPARYNLGRRRRFQHWSAEQICSCELQCNKKRVLTQPTL